MPLDRILRTLINWQNADGPPIPARARTIAEARDLYRASAIRRQPGDGPAVTAEDRAIRGTDRSPIPVRVYTPASDDGRVITYLHGGGWALGDLDTHDAACRYLAASLRAVVVAAGYRRAPEHPHPVPLRDAAATARWTARVFAGRDHVIAGDSAGASLALGVALGARDRGDLAFAAQLLFYPPVDPSLRVAAASAYATGHLLTVDDMAWHYELYVPDPRHRADPVVDLLSADLRDLPPTVLGTAEFDPLSDEGAELGSRLRAAGVPVHHDPGAGLVHGYLLMRDLVPAAAACADRMTAELDATLRTAGHGERIRGHEKRIPDQAAHG